MCEEKIKHIDPFSTETPLVIEIAHNVSEAKKLLKNGFCPVECSFGDESVVDGLKMDHHGPLSDLEGVAIRAYRDHYGARASDPHFAVTGTPDEDACFAIAALAGKIPHQSLADLIKDVSLKMIWDRNLTHVAELINQADIDPSSVDLTSDYWGRLVLYWRVLTNLTIKDVSAFHAGVVRWRDLLTTPQDKLIDVVPLALESCLQAVRSAPVEEISPKISVVNCSQWGFSYLFAHVWHKQYPIVLAFYGDGKGDGHVTFSIKDKASATRILGDKGLLAIYTDLEKFGFKNCGGRREIGGTDRDTTLTWEDAISLGKAVDELAVTKKPKKKKYTRKKSPKEANK